MDYTFTVSEIKAVLADTEAAAQHQVPYTGPQWGVPEDTTPGVLLVGDQGVYLMTNAVPMPSHRTISYAREANPHTLPFDAWWGAKRAGFGGDDGAEFITLDDARRWVAACEAAGRAVAVADIGPTSFALVAPSRARA